MGTAETPAEPIRGLIFSFRNRFMSLAMSTPSDGTEGEGDEAEDKDEDRLGFEKGFGVHRRSHGQSQEYGGDGRRLKSESHLPMGKRMGQQRELHGMMSGAMLEKGGDRGMALPRSE